MIKVETTKSMTVTDTDLTVGALIAFIDDAPADSKVSVRTQKADRPGEMSTIGIKITIKEEDK